MAQYLGPKSPGSHWLSSRLSWVADPGSWSFGPYSRLPVWGQLNEARPAVPKHRKLIAVEQKSCPFIFFTGTSGCMKSSCPKCKSKNIGSQRVCPLLTVGQALPNDHTGKPRQSGRSTGGGKETLPVTFESAFWRLGSAPSHVKGLQKWIWLWKSGFPGLRDACLRWGCWVAQVRPSTERWMVSSFVVLRVGASSEGGVSEPPQRGHRRLPLLTSKPNRFWLRLESPHATVYRAVSFLGRRRHRQITIGNGNHIKSHFQWSDL